MRTSTKIACRTRGALGTGIALYDTVRVASHVSKVEGENTKAKQLERAYFDSRTTDNMSYHSGAIGEKVFEMRSKNPLPTLWGKIKGGVMGTFKGLGSHIITLACSGLALAAKGNAAKVGAIGACLSLIYDVARNGFGLGKHHPMN